MGFAEWIFAPLPFLWIAYILGMFAIFCAVLVIPAKLMPQFVDRLLKYGKLSSGKVCHQHFAQRLIDIVEVPKRYFVHFYVFASINCTLVAILMFSCCCLQIDPPVIVVDALDVLASDSRKPIDSSVLPILVITLLALQVYRRLYECVRVSVFSNAKMNIAHYCIGMTFYTMASLSILAETPGFSRDVRGVRWDNDGVHWYSIVGIVLYFWMSFYQYQCAVAFSNLRKDKQGRVQSHAYKMPSGHLFDKVSCPHYLAEVCIYFALNLVLGFQCRLYWLVLIFVIVNQTVTAIWCHQWYLKSYPNYPKNRKAIFPYLL